jgi:hypothetical protein
MSRGARIMAVAVPVCLGAILGFTRSQRPDRDDLTGVWRLEMRAAGDPSDSRTHRGLVVLVKVGGGGAPWSFNVSKPDYVGAFSLSPPVPAYALPTLKQFPAVAVRQLAGDSIELALGSQSVDHGWLSLSGALRGDTSCGVWVLTAYAVTHRGSYCLRRNSDSR